MAIAADADTLKAARDRLATVRSAASKFEGALRTYRCGSVATSFVNEPVLDADGGVVMDRRIFPSLGPDGDNELPAGLVEDLRSHLRPLLVVDYPELRIQLMKRGLLLRFNQPLWNGDDPTVDLVLGLNRVIDNALWIPNLEQNRWDPSDPEGHVALFTSGSDSVRQTRRHVVRLAKAQVKQFVEPAICSFNVAALALECITESEAIDAALYRFFDYSATNLAKALTKDPCAVSPSIKVKNRTIAVDRLRKAADGIALAIEADDDTDKAREALAAHGVFWKLIEPPNPFGASAIHSAIASATPLTVTKTGALSTQQAGALIKPTKSYGARNETKI